MSEEQIIKMARQLGKTATNYKLFKALIKHEQTKIGMVIKKLEEPK